MVVGVVIVDPAAPSCSSSSSILLDLKKGLDHALPRPPELGGWLLKSTSR